MTHYYTKLAIKGKIRVLSGLHIGASSAFAAIGAADSPALKDPLSGLPIIPGSSLKGKLRTLLAKSLNQEVAENPNQDALEIRQLFGDSEEIRVGRLIFRDCPLMNYDELMDKGADTVTEVKFENTIDRKTAEAKPRQIERVIPQASFGLEIIYDYSSIDSEDPLAEIQQDLDVLQQGFKLLEWDYLGGNGSRGYGKVAFEDLSIEQAIGNLPSDLVQQLASKF